jgi:deoxyribonuclease-4
MLDEFDEVCGLGNVRVVHVNDSKGEAGSRKDRHAHIGEGTIGGGTSRKALRSSGFAAFVNRAELGSVPKILETPKEDTPAGTPMDRVNLRRLRGLIGPGKEPIRGSDAPGRAKRVRSATNPSGGRVV